MKSMGKKMPVQKGKVISNPMTMGQATREERVSDAKKGQKMLRKGQTLGMMSPMKGKKK